MQQQRVVVVRLSLFNISLTLLLSLSLHAQSESGYSIDPSILDITPAPTGYLARIEHNSPQEIEAALSRAEELFEKGLFKDNKRPIKLVLHGPEIEVFFKDKYSDHKTLVDLAAKLHSLGIIDVNVCETQTGVLGRSPENLHQFISTVPFGPTEVKRLSKKGYVSF